MSIFNQPIDPSLVTQLNNRQNLLGKQNRNSFELSFLNSNTSWVKLQSSVNVGGKDDTAKENVLFGGTLKHIPGKTALNSTWTHRDGLAVGLNSGSLDSPSYPLYNTAGDANVLGLRPMPGITSVNIENIGAYGSTRKATVNFQCWDVKQLELLEMLYMRPGYTVLLEFGRNNYLNNSSTALIDVNPRNNFFNDTITNLHDYLSELYRESINKGGHYDAFFGYVTNFKWIARNDGGYDCMTEILSTGEVVESLKLNYSVGDAIAYNTLAIDPLNSATFKGLFYWKNANTKNLHPSFIVRFNNEYSESILSGLIYELYTAFRYEHDAGTYSPAVARQSQILIPNPTDPKIQIPVDFATIKYQSTADETKVANPNRFLYNDDDYYITLESFCDLVSAFIIPKAYDGNKSKGDLTGISTNDRTYPKKTPSKEQLLCLYNSLVISTNPDVCWVKNDYFASAISNTIPKVNTTPSTSAYTNTDVNATWSAGLRSKINGWIEKMVAFKRPIDEVLQDIKDTQIDYISKGYAFNERAFYRAVQANYQVVRGGVINKNRNWDGLTPTVSTTLPNLLKITPPLDNTFWGVINKTYNFITASLITRSDLKYIANLIETTNVDSKLDTEIQANAAAAAAVMAAAATTTTVANSLNTIATQFKSLGFTKDFKSPKTGTSNSEFGVIGNIYVNLKHLYLLAKSQSSHSSDPSGKNIISLGRYFDSLAQNIQTSLGNLNNFKIHIDPTDGIARIIDLNYINKDQATNLFKFNIGTNDSLVRNIKLESYMSNDMMSMMSISAQASPGKIGYDNTTVVTYNKGITDRNIPEKDTPYSIGVNSATVYLNFISNIGMLVNTYLLDLLDITKVKYSWVSTGNTSLPGTAIATPITIPIPTLYRAEQSNTYSNALREIINFLTAYQRTDNADKAILPTEISLTIDGLSGFIIGNLFEVDNTFLPKYYKGSGKTGYTVTGVSHELSANDWTTTLKAFPINLESNKTSSAPITKFATIYVPSTNGAGGAAGGGAAVSFGACETDPTKWVSILPTLKKYPTRIKYSTGGNYNVDPQFAIDLETEIFPALIARTPANILFYITSATDLTRSNPNSPHLKGNGIDIQLAKLKDPTNPASGWENLSSSKLASRWAKTIYPGGWVSKTLKSFFGNKGNGLDLSKPWPTTNTHPYLADELADINDVSMAFLGSFPNTPSGRFPYMYQLTIGGGSYQLINENFTPYGTGPHFHLGRRCT
jgi:hypothetical protein